MLRHLVHDAAFFLRQCLAFLGMLPTTYRSKSNLRGVPKTKNLILLRFLSLIWIILSIFAAKSQYIEIMTPHEIGIAIKERRKKLGINQLTLADLAGVAVNTVVAIERGEGNPQMTTLIAILDTLGLQLDVNIK